MRRLCLILALSVPASGFADDTASCRKKHSCVKDPVAALIGCYRSDLDGFAPGFAIQPAGQNYVLQTGSGPTLRNQSLGAATPDDLKAVGKVYGQVLRAGLALRWDRDMHDRHPYGVYDGLSPDGKRVLLIYAAPTSGLAERVDCRAGRRPTP